LLHFLQQAEGVLFITPFYLYAIIDGSHLGIYRHVRIVQIELQNLHLAVVAVIICGANNRWIAIPLGKKYFLDIGNGATILVCGSEIVYKYCAFCWVLWPKKSICLGTKLAKNGFAVPFVSQKGNNILINSGNIIHQRVERGYVLPTDLDGYLVAEKLGDL
jgi:hypothetical protein